MQHMIFTTRLRSC